MKRRFNWLSFMLTLLALVFGADISMAVATPTPQDDDPITLPASPDQRGNNTDLRGTPATEATVANDPDWNQDEIEKIIIKFRPFNYTLSTDIETIAKQKRVTDYKQGHAVMAVPVMECELKKATTQTSTGVLVLSIGSNPSDNHITGDEARMFGRSQTIHVQGVSGYTQDEQNNAKGDLMLKVSKHTGSEIHLIPVNGYWVTNEYEVPALPVGTKLQVMATAGHTAQLKVSPKNSKPVVVNCYLQKKIMNTAIEDEWKEKKKTVNYFTDDIKENALMVFRQENERTKLCGASNVLQENDEDLGLVNCYYEEGVLPQLLMKYCTDGSLTFKNLISMQRMQFGKWSMSNTAEVYCSYGFNEMLLNLDFTKVAQTNILTEQTTYGINITKFRTSFGTFNFKLCPILDELGYEDCAMVIDMRNAVHYWKQPNRGEKKSINMSEDNKEPLEATRDIHVKIDCVCLRGYNSILIGPADKIFAIDTVYDNRDDIAEFSKNIGEEYFTLDPNATGNGEAAATPKPFVGDNTADTPTTYKDGMLVYLHDDDDYKGFSAGTIVYWDASQSDWFKYSGSITA